MKLKNNALQELYDTLVSGNPTISPYAESPFDKAFRECDEKLSGSATFAHIKKLENDIDILSAAEWEALSANKKLEKDLDDAKKNVEYFRHSRDDWRSRAKYAEDEVKELKETLEKANADRTELQKDRDSYHELYTELSKTYDKLFEDNKKLNVRTDCLRYEVEWYRKHYKDQPDKIEELKKQLDELTSQYQKLTIENKRLQDGIPTTDAAISLGQTDLWDMLQTVKDMKPEEFDPECETLGDILDMDLEDFLDAYRKWQEEKEKERLDHMRDYLARFCEGRVCNGCPLESNEYKCGCGYSFKKAAEWDVKIIPDEELERYYEKARGCGAYNLKDGKLFIHDLSHPIAGVNEAIKNACERFTKAVEAANINISTRAWHGDATAEKIKIEPWSCTLEGTINVEFDRDLLEKVCGVKPDDKK